ncbi:MAG: protein kinase [Undibacterium sp.]|nr:protein kinase [Opitutaceae bacterium]
MALPPPPTVLQLAAAFPEVTNLQHKATGGFKYVYQCEINGVTEAFKLLALPTVGKTDSERAARREYIGRAHREITLLGQCTAPELVKLGGLSPREVTIGDIDYLGYSEEFLVGESVQDFIDKDPRPQPPSEQEAKQLFISLLKAIKELWGKFETVHRDIKPLNIVMLGRPGRPFVLLDLGIAYQTREPGLTVDPAIRLATLPYMAPEMLQMNFRQALDFRADIYTAGMTTFEYATFTHALQYRQEDPHRTLSRILRQSPTPLRSMRPDFSEAFCRLIDQTLKKSPPLRPSNLSAIVARLEAEL